ncbi:WD repeat containing protein [Parasponia andersonii]|uniref:WD repeat containing protein n=1 Tax=Parasponia andersonii TaxID=3476 RepID=A0A2P5BEH7_PARAD|nr:WD repeat containing protein [Parasponia andersonii]
MAHYQGQGEDADYMADEYDMEDVDEDIDDEFRARESGGSDSDVDDFDYSHTALSPDGKLLVIVGDNPDGVLVDSQTGKTVMPLCGHLDFSFASAWHPNGVTFATGNQDKTCRIWDVRNLSKSVAVLKGNLGAIRSIRYTSDGRYMAMAEPADFVHIYDVNSGYEKEQEIDFFGEISGISFSPDTESLFIGVWDRTYGSLLEYGRRRIYAYLDSLL